MAICKDQKNDLPEENRDPITGAKGAHPVGVGVGTAVGGVVTGGALGAAAGPVGAIAGAVVGGVIGGLAGKKAGEEINPTIEDAYWRQNYRHRPYVASQTPYDEYRPAYQYGWESRSAHTGRRFEEAEPELESGWTKTKAESKLDWHKAKGAVRDAWDRIDGGPAEGTDAGIAGIKEHMDVIASCGKKVGVVDHIGGGALKLTKKNSPDGQHHFIPVGWVERVDSHVHLKKNSMETEQNWKSDAAACVCSG
jgi:hypothetical protein